MLHKRSQYNEKPMHDNKGALTRRNEGKARVATETQHSQK